MEGMARAIVSAAAEGYLHLPLVSSRSVKVS